MATTRLIPMHKIKNQSVAYTVHERIDYAINPAKTLGGELDKGQTSVYRCHTHRPRTYPYAHHLQFHPDRCKAQVMPEGG